MHAHPPNAARRRCTRTHTHTLHRHLAVDGRPVVELVAGGDRHPDVASRGPGAGKNHLQMLRRPRLDQDHQRLGQPVLRCGGSRAHADLDLLPAGDPGPGETVLGPGLQANRVALLEAARDDPEADREGGLPVPGVERLDRAVCRGREPDVAGLIRVANLEGPAQGGDPLGDEGHLAAGPQALLAGGEHDRERRAPAPGGHPPGLDDRRPQSAGTVQLLVRHEIVVPAAHPAAVLPAGIPLLSGDVPVRGVLVPGMA